MSDLEFDVAKRRVQPITFRIGGEMRLKEATDTEPEVRGPDDHEYNFKPPKSALMLMPILEGRDPSDGMGMTSATIDWLGEGLSEEENHRILGRLKDPKDDLDVENLTDIIKGLSEKSAGRPTG